MATNYLSCAETAKMIRQALKEAFPDVKFGVRSKTYSGGASINVTWTDGPNSSQVEPIAKRFEGAYFDGMIDYKGYCTSMIDGVTTSFGADFVFCNRSYSDAAIQRGIDRYYTKYEGNFKARTMDKPTVEDFKNGRLWGVQVLCDGYPYDQNVQAGVYQILNKASDRLKVCESKTAGKVIYLGNDGYSQVGALSSEAVQ